MIKTLIWPILEKENVCFKAFTDRHGTIFFQVPDLKTGFLANFELKRTYLDQHFYPQNRKK